MEILILTGMSGAGKSLAANFLEDMGYFCVDNLPPSMIPDLIKAYSHAQSQRIERDQSQRPERDQAQQPERDQPQEPERDQPQEPERDQAIQKLEREQLPDRESSERLAIVIDVRSSALFKEVIPALEQVRELGHTVRIIFLEAADQVLINRYKLSRRSHPLAKGRSLAQAIMLERERLAPLKELVSDIVETSNLGSSELRDMLYAMLTTSGQDERMTILVQSFGFKYGVPVDSDCILDVRFLPNPFYIEELRPQSGLDPAVRDYVFSFPETTTFLDMQEKLLNFTIPLYIREGKVRLMIGVGCSGGRHRSVALAEALAQRLKDSNLTIIVDHRDIDKDSRYFRKQRS